MSYRDLKELHSRLVKQDNCKRGDLLKYKLRVLPNGGYLVKVESRQVEKY